MARTKRGLSQKGLAEIAGLPSTYAGSVERGERKNSRVNNESLPNALEIPPDKLRCDKVKEELALAKGAQDDPLLKFEIPTSIIFGQKHQEY